jgi:hypothetical protein
MEILDALAPKESAGHGQRPALELEEIQQQNHQRDEQ